eukprot:3963194-Pyramimonas_sp.AAC.1
MVCYAMLCYALLLCAMPCYTMSSPIVGEPMLCHAVLCYAMLHHIPPGFALCVISVAFAVRDCGSSALGPRSGHPGG